MSKGTGSLRRVRLGDIVDIQARQVDPKSDAYRSLPHISAENIVSGRCEVVNVRTALEDGMTSGKYLYEPGNVLYSKLRPYLRKAVVVDRQGLCSADIYPLVPKDGLILAEYLAWLLVSDDFTRYADGESRRARMPKLNREQLFAWRFELPPISSQEKFLERLRRARLNVDRLSQIHDSQTQHVGALWDSFLATAFKGIIPVSAAARCADPPQGWKWGQLSQLAKLESGHTPSRRHPEWWGGDVPWISLADIRARDGQEITRTAENINDGGLENSSARLLPAETVVFSRTASVGFAAVMGREMATSQDFANWICGEDLDPWFLMFALIRARKYFRSIASGATHKTVYMPTMKSLKVCAPPLRYQKEISERLRTTSGILQRLDKATVARGEAIDALLPAQLEQLHREV